MSPIPENKLVFTVPPELDGERLDVSLSRLADDFSRVQIQKSIAAAKVLLNGKPQTAKRQPVCKGDRIEFEPPEETTMEHVAAEQIPLDILYEDDALLVISKPAGMVVHPAAGNYTGTVVNALLGRDLQATEREVPQDPQHRPLHAGQSRRL